MGLLYEVLGTFVRRRPKCKWCERTLSTAAFARGEARLTYGAGNSLDTEPPEWYEHTVDCEGVPLKEIRNRVAKRKSDGEL